MFLMNWSHLIKNPNNVSYSNKCPGTYWFFSFAKFIFFCQINQKIKTFAKFEYLFCTWRININNFKHILPPPLAEGPNFPSTHLLLETGEYILVHRENYSRINALIFYRPVAERSLRRNFALGFIQKYKINIICYCT